MCKAKYVHYVKLIMFNAVQLFVDFSEYIGQNTYLYHIILKKKNACRNI